jgi:Transposase DDE domain
MHDPTRESDWSLIEAQLPKGWSELAAEMRVIRKLPKHIGQKILDIEIALRLVLNYVAQRGSMRQTVAGAAASGLVVISQVALFKWMAKIGKYLEALVARMVDRHAYAAKAWGGYQLIAADATCVERPGAKGTTARMHYALRLADLSPRAIRITDETVGETMRNFDPEQGELWILDRGYSNPPCVEYALDRKSDILVRLNWHSMPLFTANAVPIDVRKLLRSTPDRGVAHQRKVYVRTKAGRMFAVRVCWMRLPLDDARKARMHAKRDGVKDDGELDLYEYVAVVTTADASQISGAQAIELYRARWQVELDFKRDKSIGELDRLPSLIPETIHAWICGKVLLDLIVRRLSAQEVNISPSGLATVILRSPRPFANTCNQSRTLVCDKASLDDGTQCSSVSAAA